MSSRRICESISESSCVSGNSSSLSDEPSTFSVSCSSKRFFGMLTTRAPREVMRSTGFGFEPAAVSCEKLLNGTKFSGRNIFISPCNV